MSSKLDPDRVRFTGPLAPFASGSREDLAALGYARTSATIQLHLAAHLSRWLDGVRMGPGDLSGPVIDRFLAERRSGYTSHYSRRGLSPILGYLRRVGVAPVALPVAEVPGADVVGVTALLKITKSVLATP